MSEEQSLHSLRCDNNENQDNEENQDLASRSYLNDDGLDTNKEESLQNKKRIHKKSEISNFIMKTYRILQDRRNSEIIQWTDEGTCFIVKNKDKFQNQILPKYFKHRKFSSFVRQLNMYDFHKVRKEKQIPIFKHKYFRMNCIELLHKIKRKSGEDNKEQEEQIQQVSYLQLPDKIIPSAFELKSKTNLSVNAFNEVEQLIQQNNDLIVSISELTHEISSIQQSKDRKIEKIVKILSAIIYFDLQKQLQNKNDLDPYHLRDLQNHFISEQDPLVFCRYVENICKLYNSLKGNFLKQDQIKKEELLNNSNTQNKKQNLNAESNIQNS